LLAIGRSSRKLEELANEVEHVSTILIADLTDLESATSVGVGHTGDFRIHFQVVEVI
jgi:short-subunit dehydrogenase